MKGIRGAGFTALVSGGTTGIGRAIAIEIAKLGGAVLIFGRHRKELNEALTDLRKFSARCEGLVADQASRKDVERVFSRVKSSFGRLDVLVNNAAVAADSLLKASLREIEYAVSANLTGYLFCTRLAIPLMRDGGQIIHIGSMSAEKRGAGGEVYTATKSGIRGFSESLRKSLIKKGIRVTLIEPGWTGSDLVEVSARAQRKAQAKREMLKAEDIANTVAFCLSQPKRSNLSLVQIQPLQSES